MHNPTGEQYEIAHDDQRVVVVEVGGGLRSYTVGERQILDGYGAGEMATAGRGQVQPRGPTGCRTGRTSSRGGATSCR